MESSVYTMFMDAAKVESYREFQQLFFTGASQVSDLKV
jgi:hypothetical protein